jgi:hypothetical protein
VPKSPDVLNSWKEIAQYIACGVRTAQRWERDLLMPVHRPRERSRSRVLAFKSEIDQWVKSRGSSSEVLEVSGASLSEAISELESLLEANVGSSPVQLKIILSVNFDGKSKKADGHAQSDGFAQGDGSAAGGSSTTWKIVSRHERQA